MNRTRTGPLGRSSSRARHRIRLCWVRWGAMSPRSDRRIGPFLGACLLAVVFVAGCATSSTKSSEKNAAGTSSQSSSSSSSTSSSSPTSSTTSVAPTTPVPQSASTRDRLAVLSIDDRQTPQGTYHREEWPHWADVDGNGCDARQDALAVWSVVAATVNRSGTCKVVAGSWVSPYDGVTSNNPSDFDVDHLVPLEMPFAPVVGRGALSVAAPLRTIRANSLSHRHRRTVQKVPIHQMNGAQRIGIPGVRMPMVG